jgi:hypothetical protein
VLGAGLVGEDQEELLVGGLGVGLGEGNEEGEGEYEVESAAHVFGLDADFGKVARQLILLSMCRQDSGGPNHG